MPWRLLLASLLVAGAEAFAPAPIRLGRHSAKIIVLAQRDPHNLVLEASGSVALPQKLVIREQTVGTSPIAVPHFVLRLDKTIAWAGTPFCIEASGDKSQDAVHLNRCTGAASQLWNFALPGQIQLINTNMCIDVERVDTSLNEVSVELRECDDKLAVSWAFEEPRLATQGLARSSSTWPLVISLLAMAAVGILILSTWLWEWQSEAYSVGVGQSSVSSGVDRGGISLTPLANDEENVTHLGSSTGLPRLRTQPWVLPRAPQPIASMGANGMASTRAPGQGETNRDDPLLSALRNRFGLSDFRPGQREIIETVTNGIDALVVLPTGGGKSLCYQLPAVVRGGTTLVVSPLISLMKDQVDALRAKNVRATFINSTLSDGETRERLEGVLRSEWELVYVAPERFDSHYFMDALKHFDISLFAIDEAHCISQWGHDFRPSYKRLQEVRAALKDPPTVALTATANSRCQSDILTSLGISNSKRFIQGFDRPNLSLGVVRCRDEEHKLQKLREIVKKGFLDGPTLVYCSTKKNVSLALGTLQACGTNLKVEEYHASLQDDERAAVQDQFMQGTTDVVVATNAFGMGIDKANIRTVIHFNHPGTLEAYYQEIGRAGRDGLPSRAVLLFSASDRRVHEFFIKLAYPSEKAVRYVWEALWELDSTERHRSGVVKNALWEEHAFHADLFFTQRELFDKICERHGGPNGDASWELGGAAAVGCCLKMLALGGLARLIHRNDRKLAIRVPYTGSSPSVLRGRQKEVFEFVQARAASESRSDMLAIAPESLAGDLGITRSQLLTTLTILDEKGLIDYEKPGNSGGARLLVDTEELDVDMLGDTMEKAMARRDLLNDNLGVMVNYSSADCQRKYILEYFGEVAPFVRCGNCHGCGIFKRERKKAHGLGSSAAAESSHEGRYWRESSHGVRRKAPSRDALERKPSPSTAPKAGIVDWRAPTVGRRVADRTEPANEDWFTPMCDCAVPRPAALLTVRKDGPNRGRQFYKCGDCDFFLWADSAAAEVAMRRQTTKALLLKQGENSKTLQTRTEDLQIDKRLRAQPKRQAGRATELTRSAGVKIDRRLQTVVVLKAELKSRGLKVGGKKAELIRRLEMSDAFKSW